MIAVLDNARPCQVINWSHYSKDSSEITGSNDITVLTRSYDKMGIRYPSLTTDCMRVVDRSRDIICNESRIVLCDWLHCYEER